MDKEAIYEPERTSELHPSLEKTGRKCLQVELGWGGSALGNGPVSTTELHLGLASNVAASSSAQFRASLATLVHGETGVINKILGAGILKEESKKSMHLRPVPE